MGCSRIKILVNEQTQSVQSGVTVEVVRDKLKPAADVLVINGFPCSPDTEVKEGDRVVLIRRGETPEVEELESLMVARHSPGVHARIERGCGGYCRSGRPWLYCGNGIGTNGHRNINLGGF